MSKKHDSDIFLIDREDHFNRSIPLSLRLKPDSEESVELVNKIALKISNRENPPKKHIKIIGAILGDMLKATSMNSQYGCYRAMSAGSFSKYHYGYKPFIAVRDGLIREEYIRMVPGRQPFDDIPGIVSRLYPKAKLVSDLAAVGIDRTNYAKHFSERSDIPLVHRPVRIKSSSTRNKGQKKDGSPLPLKKSPKLPELENNMNCINRFLQNQKFEGMNFDGLFRSFNQGDRTGFDYNKGGRLYAVGGGYQQLDKVTGRPHIKINGKRTVEVDIRASHLTIFHALMGVPLPGAGDPYETGEIGRDGIKIFCSITLGSGKLPSRWSVDACKDYRKSFEKRPVSGLTGDLKIDYPFKKVKDIALRHIPLLNSIESCGYSWADFQYLESEVIIKSINSLIDEEIVTLPLHDSLISTSEDHERVSNVIVQKFNEIMGVECNIKTKGI